MINWCNYTESDVIASGITPGLKRYTVSLVRSGKYRVMSLGWANIVIGEADTLKEGMRLAENHAKERHS